MDHTSTTLFAVRMQTAFPSICPGIAVAARLSISVAPPLGPEDDDGAGDGGR
jgi:hypothetical protein